MMVSQILTQQEVVTKFENLSSSCDVHCTEFSKHPEKKVARVRVSKAL